MRYILLIPLALLVVPLALVAALVALAICLGLAIFFLPIFLLGILPCVVATKCRRVAKRRYGKKRWNENESLAHSNLSLGGVQTQL